MNIGAQILLVFLGLALLYYGAEFLIKGGVSIARTFRVPALVIGLTLVAFGTSAPELVVSVDATWRGHGEVSFGNVIGSNICNIALILGLCALIAPIPVNRRLFRLDVWVMAGSAALFTLFFMNNHDISEMEAVVLILIFTGYVCWQLFSALLSNADVCDGDGQSQHKNYPLWAAALLAVSGLIGLVFGAKLLVNSAVAIAKAMNVSEAVIGLTLVAVGTSLPELATSVVAAIKHEHDIAIGNVIGSNIFNILCIMGIAPLTRAASAPGIGYLDPILMLVLSLLLLPLMATGMAISRFEGAFLLVIYVIYTIGRFCSL